MKGIFTKIWIGLASVVVMLMSVILIAIIHIFKFFRKFKLKDPFHNSRQHPLNSPTAPRG